MRQRKIKLGEGELEHIHEDGLSLSIKDARDYFLDAVKEFAPEVLDDLANEPFKLYKAAGLALDRESYKKEFENLEFYDQIRAMAKVENQHRWNHPDWKKHFENKEVDYDKNILAMQKSIFDWSKEHNLDANWCRARAYETLDWWYWSDSFYENRIWNYESEMQPISSRFTPVFQFSYKSLYPVFRFRNEEKEVITKAFEIELNKFLDERERVAKEDGMVKPKQKREYLHFVWFALWLVKERTQEEIQHQFNLDSRRTVGEALDDVRNLLKTPNDPKSILTRPDNRGRPRKS